ncbi:MAG: hydroxymethylpyrimidine/phosphomethylpyrimidine kinase, partial [Planctomycetota bacterium]
MSEELPAVLVIGGHDSSGGAGVDADREALECAGVDASIVVTAWTVQDSQGLRDLGAVDPEVWGREALAESKNLAGSFRTVKFGLLPSAAAVSTAAKLAAAWAGRVNIVIDPVIAPSRGGRFLDFSALEAYREKLLPLGGIWTPNLPELAELVACDPSELALEPGLRV